MSYLKRVLTLLLIVFDILITDAKSLSIIKKDSVSKDTLKELNGIWLRADFTKRLIKYGSPRLVDDYIPNIMSFNSCLGFEDSCVELFTHTAREIAMGSTVFHRDNDSIVFNTPFADCYKMYFSTNSKEANCVFSISTWLGANDTLVKYIKIGKESCETTITAFDKLSRIINKTLFAGNWELLNLKALEKQMLVIDEEGKIQNWQDFNSYSLSTDIATFTCTDCASYSDKLSQLNLTIDLIGFTTNAENKEEWFGYKHNGTTIDFWNALDGTQTIVYQLKRQ